MCYCFNAPALILLFDMRISLGAMLLLFSLQVYSMNPSFVTAITESISMNIPIELKCHFEPHNTSQQLHVWEK